MCWFRQMRMWIIPALGRRSSPGCWSPQGFRVGVSGPAGLAAARKAFWRWESPGWLSWCPAATLIPWWLTTPLPNGAAAKMHTVPAAKQGTVPTGPYDRLYPAVTRSCFPSVPVIIGGLEASLRRFAHYDYWDDAGAPLHPGGRAARICCPTEWGNTRPWRSPGGWRRGTGFSP